MMNPDGDFAPNGIQLWYYSEPTFSSFSSSFAYANEEKPILIGTDFKWENGNDFSTFRKHATLTCRFSTQSEPVKSLVVPAIMEVSPVGAYHTEQLPNQVRCRTPQWKTTEVLILEVSVNGQDYMGSHQITIVEQLSAFKISPLSGPINGNTQVKVYGLGLSASIPKEKEVYVRFGTGDSQ